MKNLKWLARILQIALFVTFALALGGAFIPGSIGHISGTACIVILITAPVVRVGWLVVDWVRQGDKRFALLGCVLLLVLAASGAIALVR
jgi:hypothetical protein